MNKRQELSRCAKPNLCGQSGSWIDQELADCQFRDVRLGKRVRKLLRQLADGAGGSIPCACQDWANTKAAYRFFANAEVSEAEILMGHFQATRERFVASPGTVLILHDTTEFVYHREDVAAVGVLGDSIPGRDNRGRLRHHTCAAFRCTPVWPSPCKVYRSA